MRGRLDRLDALRGIAAIVVLVHHVSMTVPQIATAYESSDGVMLYSIGWWATLSPLKVLLAGPEFVLVFFVLSGFVLVRSPLAARQTGQRYDWVAYYVRRIIRLAVPVLIRRASQSSGSCWCPARSAQRAVRGWPDKRPLPRPRARPQNGLCSGLPSGA